MLREKIIHAWGSTRISNPKTLQNWIDRGWFQKQLDEGYNFYSGCGRFRTEVCSCSKCRKNPRPDLDEIVNKRI